MAEDLHPVNTGFRVWSRSGAGAGGQESSAGYSEVTTADESDLWKELDKGLQSLKSPDGVIIVHKTSNTVLVKDYPAQIRKIAEYLEHGDRVGPAAGTD